MIYLQDQIGESKPFQINCVDYIHLTLGPFPGSYLLFADAFGRLSILRYKDPFSSLKFIYHDQLCFNQIISAKWLTDSHH
jgi:hypothetical protein